MQGEVLATAAQTLGLVDGFVRKFVEGEQIHSACDPAFIECPFSLDGNASANCVRKIPGMFCW
jgi:hypothetical protein